MLQLTQSAKRMGKLKKYKSKTKESGFQFLLQSLDRDKENQVPNLGIGNQHQLARSVHIDPLLTAPVYSCAGSTLNPGKREKGKFYLQNVKLLDRSDVSLTEMDQSSLSKKSHNNRSSKHSKSRGHRKQGNKNISNRSKQSEGEQFQELMYKMKLYLSITDDLIDQVDTSKWKYAKKARQISQELTALLAQAETDQRDRRNKLNLSVKTTSFNMFGSEILAPSQSFVKRINGLEQQKQKLSNLVSQHEMANIKMFVKINQGDSEEIQQCKKDAARLFENYKKLERVIRAEKKKLIQALAEKEELVRGNEELRSQNEELLVLVEKYQLALEKHNHPKKGILKVSILQPQRENSYPSYQPSQLHIQSLQNSCNSSGFEEDIGLSSSITTNTSRIKKGAKLGINLNALLDNLNQTELKKLAASPEKLKRTLKECRETIVKMENIINQQNKELELSIRTLEAFQSTIREKDQRIRDMDTKLLHLENQMARLSKEKKPQEIRPKKSKKQERQKVEIDERGRVCLDTNPKKGRFDEYRIIATQALALEQALRNNQIK